ncbi:hypothetical protein [Novipirellula artificiosorum]|uniref:PEP-CTERM protein-sorting domain-containing protein n=1 Tax=Novipirellula artificiosorum TaxID=2528016 RepID=A0A5C6E073_9BACT|nr:hypothetical protein [Novipirellula artificiosorum]TWU40539.1 hypothetical protein Poly41_13720 [Novipirellula artificiosorum]
MRLPCIAVLLVIPSMTHAAIIDTFSVGTQGVVANAADNNVRSDLNGLDSSQVLDGRRALTIQGEISLGLIVAAVDTSGGGMLSYASNNPVFTNAFDGRLLLTHVPGDRINTFDLSPFSSQFYIVDFNQAFFGGNGPLDATVRVSSPSGSDFTVFSIPESVTPFRVAVPMSELAGADLSDAYSLTLDINGIPSTASFEISEIRFATSVPEPSGCVALCCMAVGGIASFYKRRSQNG